jgi:hypothetical protein
MVGFDVTADGLETLALSLDADVVRSRAASVRAMTSTRSSEPRRTTVARSTA